MSSDYQLEDTIYLPFTTRAFGTGIPTALVSGVVDVYENVTATPIVTAETLTVSLNGHAGFNVITITATAASGFEVGGSYTAILDAGTVDSVSVIGEVVAHFTLDAGAAAQDLANGTDGLTALKTGIDGVPTTAEFEARTIVAADYFDPAADTVATVTTVTNQVSADMTAISGDSVAADNLEAMYDGTGYVDATAPASRDQVGALGSSSGGSLSFEANADNSGGTIDPGSTAFVGVETNNFTDTDLEDGVYHIIADATNVIDVVYGFSVGGGRTASELIFKGFANVNNDDLSISAWDHVGAGWDILGTLNGQNGSSNVTITEALLSRHTGTGTELGKTYVRFNGSSLSASADLNTDQILIEAVGIGQSVGYANGRIWVDTVNGVAGTEAFVNGVADNPTNLIASAKTLSTSVGVSDFHIINGSTITLAESTVNESYFGDNWTLALNSQDVDEAYFQGPHVSGVGVSATEVHFEGCDVGTASIQRGHFDFCSFDATITHTLAGDYNYHNCYSKVPGVGGPTFTKTAGQVVTVQFRNWSGSITVSGIEASDVMTISGTELGDVVLNGAEGTVKILGIYESLTDNRTGSPTLIKGAFEGSDVTDIRVDTTEIGTAGAGLTNINLPNQTMGIIGDITGNLSGSVGSVTGAVGSVAGNVDGNVTGSVGSLAAQAVTDILTTQMTEAYNSDGTAPTLAQALFGILQQAGEFAISGTTITVKKLDGSTTAMTFTLDDDANPTSRTRAT